MAYPCRRRYMKINIHDYLDREHIYKFKKTTRGVLMLGVFFKAIRGMEAEAESPWTDLRRAIKGNI